MCHAPSRQAYPKRAVRMSKVLINRAGLVPCTLTRPAWRTLRSPKPYHTRLCCSNCKKDVAQTLYKTQTPQRKKLLQDNARVFLTWLCTAGFVEIAHAAELADSAQPYVPSPIHIGWEVYVGAIAGVIPFIIGAYQFTARILIQRRCETCKGSGLVQRGRFQRKCPECGGFFPWQGWKQFLTSTAAPGNGGVLRQPRNQDGVIYRVPSQKPQDDVKDKL